MYTTGELAKCCGVSVRTVQYYDTREILTPSGLSEGGRRLYSEEDRKRLEIICFLREAGLSLGSISALLSEADPASVISVLIEQQEQDLRKELSDCQEKLRLLSGIRSSLRDMEGFSVESIGDIARIMKTRQQLKKIRTVMLASAIPFGIMEWTSIFLWIFEGIWWPFALYTALAIPYVVWLFRYYWNHVSYICPQCHSVFKPQKREFFFAKHTFATRRLTCPCCGYQGFCIETADEEETK